MKMILKMVFQAESVNDQKRSDQVVSTFELERWRRYDRCVPRYLVT